MYHNTEIPQPVSHPKKSQDCPDWLAESLAKTVPKSANSCWQDI